MVRLAMFGLRVPELLIIFAVVLLLFGGPVSPASQEHRRR